MRLYNKIELLLLTLLTSFQTFGQQQLVAEPEVANVGEILYQQPRTIAYRLINKTAQPITITSVISSCGCTEVSWPNTPIPAGEAAQLSATYDARMLGTFQKEIEVYTNVSSEPIYLTFQGRVVADASDYSGSFPVDFGNIKLSTSTIEFDDVNLGDHPEAHIMVLNNSRKTFRPQLMHLPSYLSATYHPEQLAAGRVGRIALRLNSERLLGYGLSQTSIYMARFMGDKVGPDNEIDVSAILLPTLPKLTAEEMAKAPILVTETDTLDFTESLQKKSRKVKKSITIGNAGKTMLTVHSVQVYGRAVTVSVGSRKIKPDGTTKLTMTIDTRALQQRKTEPRVLLITNDPRHPKTILTCKVKN